jgi:hypothetical protein
MLQLPTLLLQSDKAACCRPKSDGSIATQQTLYTPAVTASACSSMHQDLQQYSCTAPEQSSMH